MKKFFKGLSMICLALVLLCPLALVGCDKNYTINIQIVQSDEGSGFVYLKDVNGISVVGETAVDEGEKFEYYVDPAKGYKIAKVVINGVEQTGYNEEGAYFYFDNVKKNYTVKVSFDVKEYDVNFYCLTSGGGFELFKTVKVDHGSSIDLNQTTYGGEIALWYVIKNNQNIYLYNNSTDITASKDNIEPGNIEGIESNILFVYENKSVYCQKTAEQLIAMGVVR